MGMLLQKFSDNLIPSSTSGRSPYLGLLLFAVRSVRPQGVCFAEGYLSMQIRYDPLSWCVSALTVETDDWRSECDYITVDPISF
jgi:hypothetical protein